MTRKHLIAGNWKMNETIPEAVVLAQEISNLMERDWLEMVDVAVCPPFVDLKPVKTVFEFDRVPLMELYQAYTDYHGMMDLTENMLRYVAQEVCGTTAVPYSGEILDLGKPFERITMVDAVKKYAGVDFDQIPDTEAARKLADEKGVHYEARHAKGDILNLFFEEFVEEHLIQPTFVMDHPVEISPLTKRKPDKPDYVERFELFIYGRELCNAYSELNDPIDQRERFRAQEADRKSTRLNSSHWS